MTLRGVARMAAALTAAACLVISVSAAEAATPPGTGSLPVCGAESSVPQAGSARDRPASARRRCITLAELARQSDGGAASRREIDASPVTRAGIVQTAGGIVGTGVSAVTGTVGSILGDGESAIAGVALRGIAGWMAAGARAAVHEAGHVLGEVTAPQLTSAWFSATYWRVAGLGALLTIPFLFAAAVQAIAHGDLALLGRAAFGHLPVALLGVSLAAPVVMLLLAATDEMCGVVAQASGASSESFLDHVAVAIGSLGAAGGSFFIVVLALLATFTAIALTLEMLLRSAAVYVVVLMLPMAFAALVWPARRRLVGRMLELLIGLVLSKFVIVAVLTLAGAAIVHTTASGSVASMLAGVALLLLSVFAPWTLMRLLPFSEVAAGAGAMLRAEAQRGIDAGRRVLPVEDPARRLLQGAGGETRDLARPEPDGGGPADVATVARAGDVSSRGAAGREPDANGRGAAAGSATEPADVGAGAGALLPKAIGAPGGSAGDGSPRGGAGGPAVDATGASTASGDSDPPEPAAAFRLADPDREWSYGPGEPIVPLWERLPDQAPEPAEPPSTPNDTEGPL